MLLGLAAGARINSVSYAARGFTRQVARRPSNTRSRHPWLQAMQVLISDFAAFARLARQFRVREQRPRHGNEIGGFAGEQCFGIAGALKRFVAITGSRVAALMRADTQPKAPRGTMPAMVGIRASCQPMPVLRGDAGAFDLAEQPHRVRARVRPATRSRPEMRKMMMKSRPNRGANPSHDFECEPRTGSRAEPPHSSVRRWCTGRELVER